MLIVPLERAVMLSPRPAVYWQRDHVEPDHSGRVRKWSGWQVKLSSLAVPCAAFSCEGHERDSTAVTEDHILRVPATVVALHSLRRRF